MRRLSIVAVSLLLLLALGGTYSVAQTYQEAPMLSAMVAAGELPPVEQRLPNEPYVGIDQVPVSDLLGGKLEIGRYGGIIKGDTPHNQWRIEAIGKKGVRFDPQEAYPNFFKDFSVSPDGKVYSFTLREGLKWSDGMPHTTEDVRFWYEDVLLNGDLTPSIRIDFMSGSRGDAEVMKLNVVDESTFEFIYDETPWDLLQYFSHVDWDPVAYSKSFFSQYHADYTPVAEIDAAAVEHGFEKGEWAKLFRHLSGWPKLPVTLPTISPFLLKENNAQQMVWERNPYYWKVDAANNQLPYLDGWVWVKTADTEAMNMQIIAGEIDLAHQTPDAASAALYKQYGDDKGYDVRLLKDHFAAAEFFLNLTNEDPNWRQVVRDIRFRKAVSMALDRQRIIDTVYAGFAGPPQTVAIPAYDPDGANRLLDEMGLDQKDSDGFRLGPNGERFEIFIEHTTWYPEMKVMPEAIKSELEKVGIAVRTQLREGGLFWERHNSNQLYAGNLWFHHGIWPYHWYEDFLGIRWAQQWFNWSKSGGMQGEEPPPEYQELWELHRQMKTSQDYAERDRLWTEIQNKLSENLFWIPIIEYAEKPAIVNKKLGNTVVSGYTNFNNYHLELIYWKE